MYSTDVNLINLAIKKEMKKAYFRIYFEDNEFEKLKNEQLLYSTF